MTPRFAFPAIAIICSIALAGCGLGPGPGTSDVSLIVTRSFGATTMGSATESKVPGAETVMRMLQRFFRVGARYGGGFVESINGLSGNASRLDWFYYVNGVEAPVGAASTAVHKGDRIWWDLHDWSATESIPAVVGSFPEPFVHGIGGKRLPTTLQCAPDASEACAIVARELRSIGVPVAGQLLGTGSGSDSLGVIVAPWREMRGSLAADLVERGPSASGIYARFGGPGGSELQLLDPHGNVVRTLSADGGLIAATAQGSSPPVWLITGTDPKGVRAAATVLTPSHLRDRFALAVQGSSGLPLPLGSST